MSVTIFVLCCAVLCDNCKCRDGKGMGNVWEDKYLFIGMWRAWVVLIGLGVFLI